MLERAVKVAVCLSLLFLAPCAGAERRRADIRFPDAVPGNPMVHQDGARIVDGKGQPLKLRGVNLGAWLLWEGWTWGGGIVSESTMRERLRDLVGPDETERFRQQVYESFITERDIARIAAMGFNSVRVPINHVVLEEDDRPFVYKESGWRILDNLLSWCESHGVYVILDLHSAPGAQWWLFTADPDKNKKDRLWTSAASQERTVALWKAMARRYRDRRIVAGYDLLNEPTSVPNRTLVSFYRRLVGAIREVDPHHAVILEGGRMATDLSIFQEPLSGNQVYSFHMYTWFGDSRKKHLERYKKVSDAQRAPLWCGEFGENKYEMIKSTVELFEDPRYGVSGWSFYTWKRSSRGGRKFPALVSLETTDRWQRVIEWIGTHKPLRRKPSRQEALEGMKEFIAGLQRGRQVEDPRMVDALSTRSRLALRP